MRCAETVYLSHSYIKTIFLPRQARDEHRENSKTDRFLSGARVCVRCHAMALPEIRRAIEKLADVTKDNVEDLEKEVRLLRHLIVRMIILPRQAWDKHSGNSK